MKKGSMLTKLIQRCINFLGAFQIVAGWWGHQPGRATVVGVPTEHSNQTVATSDSYPIWDAPDFLKKNYNKCKRHFNLLVIILLQLLFCNSALGTIYYVSTAGNDTNNGTSLTTPWRNLNYAVNFAGLTGGDIIYVRGGTYSERVIMNKSGAAGSFITIKNYNTEVPIINGTGQTFTTPAHQGLFEARGSYTVIDGLKVINSRSDLDATGILVAGPVSFVTIKNCITNNTSSSGIAVWGFSSSYNGATNIVIEYNDISEAVCGGYQENLTIAGGVDNFVVRFNKVHDCLTAPNAVNIPLGIDAKTNVRNGQIYGNNIYNLSYASGIYVDGYDNTAYNIDIYNNIVHNVAWYGVSVGAEQGGSDYNINIYNNLLYNNGGHGISINGSNISTPNNIHDVKIYNNSVYGNGGVNGGNGICILNSAAYNIVVKNNIISQNTWANSVVVYSSNKSNTTVSNNICDGVQNAYLPGTEYVIGAGSISSSPSFVNAGSGNFKLNAGSPAINSATNTLVPSTDFDGNARPVGGGYDIGAYEYGSTSGTVAVTGVTISPTTVSINVSATQQLTATIAPATATNKIVSWSSGNTAIATVNASGLVTAIAAGTATITATTQDGNKTATCAVTVNAASNNLLVNAGFETALTTGWTADWGNAALSTTSKRSGTYSLKVGPAAGGRAQILSAGFTIGSSYTLSAWAMLSSAGSGASVGVLCKNSSGTQLGNFSSSDITNTGSFLQKTVTFTVPANTTTMEVYVYYNGGTASVFVDDYSLISNTASVAVTGVAMSPTTASILANATQQLTATITPANATNKILSWSSSNTAIATVSASGLVTAKAAGTATITVTSQSGNKTATCAVTVNSVPINILVNTGFENALTTGWTADWGNAALSTTSKRSGTYSLKVGPASGGRAQILSAGFTVGATYTLSAWAMLSAAGSGASIGVLCKNSSGTQVGNFSSSSITNTGSFVQKIVTFTVPAATTTMEVYVYYDGGIASVFVDDYALVSGSSPGARMISTNSLTVTNFIDKVSIYPNPLNGESLIISTPPFAGKKSVCLYDMSGKLIFNQTLQGASTQTIRMGKNISKGTYILKIISTTEVYQQRLIVN